MKYSYIYLNNLQNSYKQLTLSKILHSTGEVK